MLLSKGITGSNIRLCTATIHHIEKIVECTNDAFMADAFFKKPEFHKRFTPEDVYSLMNKPHSSFIIAFEGESEEDLVGSIYVEWDFEEQVGEVLTGHFSAVSVPQKYGGRGIGKALVSAVEDKLLEIAASDSQTEVLRVVSAMGVLNVRPDLFPWYENQGYFRQGRLPDTPELSRIKLDDAADVYCILFSKQLK